MSTIQVLDKKFIPSIKADEILTQVRRVASEINKDYEGQEPLFLVVLNGSFIFAADLMREVTVPAEALDTKLCAVQRNSVPHRRMSDNIRLPFLKLLPPLPYFTRKKSTIILSIPLSF